MLLFHERFRMQRSGCLVITYLFICIWAQKVLTFLHMDYVDSSPHKGSFKLIRRKLYLVEIYVTSSVGCNIIKEIENWHRRCCRGLVTLRVCWEPTHLYNHFNKWCEGWAVTTQTVISEHSSEICGIPNPFLFGSTLGQLFPKSLSCLDNVIFKLGHSYHYIEINSK